MKYIPADKLIAGLTKMQFDLNAAYRKPQSDNIVRAISLEYDDILSLVDSLQQDKDVLDLCSQVWWEEQGWIMIPPNVTLKGIESLLERVRHKIKWNEENGIEEQEQREQPEVDLEKEIKFFLTDAIKMNKGQWRGEYHIGEIGIRAIAHRFYELGLNARKEE